MPSISQRPPEARPLRRAPPSPAGAKEPCWRVWGQELWAALASLWRSPRYALPALLSLTLSVGGATAVFSVFSALVLRPLPLPEPEQLVRLGVTRLGSKDVIPALSAPDIEDLRALDSVFAGIAASRGWTGHVTGVGPAKHLIHEVTAHDYFDALGVEAIVGRTFTARGPAPDGEDVVVLRRRAWLTEFGGAPIVGETILVNAQPKLVLGIVADEQAMPTWTDIWSPSRELMTHGDRSTWLFRGIGRLERGVSVEQARQRLREHAEAAPRRTAAGELLTLTVTPLRESLVGDRSGLVAAMLAAVAAFALLACANLAALLGTRASTRRHERAVRAALGASRWDLGRRNVMEASLLVLSGGALGLVVAQLFMARWAEDYRDLLGNLPPRLDAHVVGVFIALLAVTATVGALAPALQGRRVRPMDALRGEGRSSPGRRARRVRELLVAVQVAVTLALLINAAAIARSVRAVLAIHPGFDTEGIVTATVALPTIRRSAPSASPPEVSYEDQEADARRRLAPLADRLAPLIGARSVCLASELPFDNNGQTRRIEPEPSAGRPATSALVHHISPGCLATLGIPMLSGRDFTDRDTNVAIINRALARELFGADDAVGRRARFAVPPGGGGAPPPPWWEIIATIGDAAEHELTDPPPPAVYLSFPDNPLQMGGYSNVFFSVAARASGDATPLLAALPRVIPELAADAAVFDVAPLGEWVLRSVRDRTALERLLSVFAAAAVLLAAVGLFGVTGYAVAERSAELGIRRALGASRRELLALVLRETAWVLIAGIAAGLVLASAAHDALRAFLFGVSVTDPVIVVGACLGLLVVGLLAALGPARAAANVSPLRALAGR